MGEDSHEITSRREFRESRKQFREILIIKPEALSRRILFYKVMKMALEKFRKFK